MVTNPKIVEKQAKAKAVREKKKRTQAEKDENKIDSDEPLVKKKKGKVKVSMTSAVVPGSYKAYICRWLRLMTATMISKHQWL
jgi:hypothetical protein